MKFNRSPKLQYPSFPRVSTSLGEKFDSTSFSRPSLPVIFIRFTPPRAIRPIRFRILIKLANGKRCLPPYSSSREIIIGSVRHGSLYYSRARDNMHRRKITNCARIFGARLINELATFRGSDYIFGAVMNGCVEA